MDVGPTHAAAPVNEEDKLAMGLPQVRLERLEVRTEVEHDDRMVGNVLVEAFPDDFCLEEKEKRSLGIQGVHAAHVVSHRSPSIAKIPLTLCTRDFQVDCTWLSIC